MILKWSMLVLAWVYQTHVVSVESCFPNMKRAMSLPIAPTKELPAFAFQHTKYPLDVNSTRKYVAGQLGVPNDFVHFTNLRLSGGLTRTVTNAKELSCGFNPLEMELQNCCWKNVRGASDDLDWLIVSKMVDHGPTRAQLGVVFGNDTDKILPDTSFAITGTRNTHELIYAFLASCVISCQHGEAHLFLDQWTSKKALLDICVLPVGLREFTFCKSVRNEDSTGIIVTIPEQMDPFQIIIIASEFTHADGGMVAIDNIEYRASICGKNEPPIPFEMSIPVNPPVNVPVVKAGFEFEEACSALGCDWSSKSCEWEAFTPTFGHGHAIPFETHVGRIGNRATGVMARADADVYLGGRVPPESVLTFRSRPFNAPTDLELHAEIFEATDGLSLHACVDDVNEPSCTQLSIKGVKADHRRWRPIRFRIPKGNRQVFIVAENSGIQLAAVGIHDFELYTIENETNELAKIDCIEKTTKRKSTTQR